VTWPSHALKVAVSPFVRFQSTSKKSVYRKIRRNGDRFSNASWSSARRRSRRGSGSKRSEETLTASGVEGIFVPTFPVVNPYWERHNLLIIGTRSHRSWCSQYVLRFYGFGSVARFFPTDEVRGTLGTALFFRVPTGNRPGTTLRTVGTFIVRSCDTAIPISLPVAHGIRLRICIPTWSSST
jgi:hypothetical protein